MRSRLCRLRYYLIPSLSDELYSRPMPPMLRFWRNDEWIDPPGDGNFGGEEAGVRKKERLVIISRNESNCLRDKALCSVSNGRIGGTPPNPSIAVTREQYCIFIHLLVNDFSRVWSESNDIVWNLFTSNGWRVLRHHILEIRGTGWSADNGRAEQTVGRTREFLANVVPKHLEVGHLSRDAVAISPCCAGRVRLNDNRQCAGSCVRGRQRSCGAWPWTIWPIGWLRRGGRNGLNLLNVLKTRSVLNNVSQADIDKFQHIVRHGYLGPSARNENATYLQKKNLKETLWGWCKLHQAYCPAFQRDYLWLDLTFNNFVRMEALNGWPN